MAFDPQSLVPLIGAVNPNGGSAFLRGWQRAQQERQAREAQAQTRTIQQEQLGFQRDANTRANEAGERATQQQQMQAVNSLRTLLEDPTIDDPAVFDQRMQFASQFAPQMGVDPGFIQSLRPAPTVFQQRAAKKKLADIEKTYGAPQLAMLEADDQTGAAPVFEVNGERLTIAQLRERAGTQPMTATGQAVSMRPQARPDVPNTPEEQFYATYARERGKASFVELSAEEQTTARDKWATAGREGRDPVLGEINRQIAQMRLDNLRDAKNTTGLPPTVQRRVDAQVNAFRNEAAVKRANVIAEAVSFVDSIPDDTKNAADNQAMIYAFAKAMDPESVVREGEYATVQKYAQSWLDTFGFSALRVLDNREFLTPEAMRNLKATIRRRYSASRGMYQNLVNQYSTQINRATGHQDGREYLIDYAAGFPSVAGETPREPTATRVTPPPASDGVAPVVSGAAPSNPYRDRANAR